jgi:hypothetical protein
MSALPEMHKHMSEAEYLTFERDNQIKHEFLDGEVYAMSGASEAHNLITASTITALYSQLRGRPCKTYPSDMRVRTPATRSYVYPDITVVCSEAQFDVPPSYLIPGARTQALNLRSLHTNNAHYVISSDFSLSVSHDSYERQQCTVPGQSGGTNGMFATMSSSETAVCESLPGEVPLPEPEPPSQDATFTNLRFYDEHQALISSIFYALWNENSEDRIYFGDDAILSHPDLTDAEVQAATRDNQSREIASFLVQSPYCVNGVNEAADEPPNDYDGWDPNILEIIHCDDHRYLDASVIINGFLHYERTLPHNPNDPDQIIGSVYGYLATNFAGTFGSGGGANTLWDRMAQCGQFIVGYPVSLTGSDGVTVHTYGTFARIADHLDEIGLYNRILSSDTATEQQKQEAEMLKNRLPGRFRLQALAASYIDGFLNCRLNDGIVELIDIKHPRVSGQIAQAINTLYLQEEDPTGGAFNRRAPNIPNPSLQPPSRAIATIIGGGLNVDSSIASTYYSDQTIDVVSDCSVGNITTDNSSPDPNLFQYIDAVRSCYFPGITRIQPVLRLDINAVTGAFTQYNWEGISYGIEGQPIDRYNVDICADFGRCR